MTFEPQPAPGPCFSFERRDQVLGLFAKWDSLKLLGIVPGPLPDERLSLCKGGGVDRQIGRAPPDPCAAFLQAWNVTLWIVRWS